MTRPPSRRRPNNEKLASQMGAALSIALHAFLLAGILFTFRGSDGVQIIAAGPGEGGEGGGGAIEVGVADPSAILGFARPQAVSFLGDEDNPVNTARVERATPDAAPEDEILPTTPRDPSDPNAIKTDRPVVPQQERVFTGKDERGRSASNSAQVGRSYGSPTPSLVGGVGIGQGGGTGVGTGLPGGSAYGRLIQGIFSRNYNPPAVEASEPGFVIIRVRIARDGRILSISGGRVAPQYIRQRSPYALVNNAAERAVLAANPLPPFPAGFLSGVDEAYADIWFRYPK